MAVKHDPQTAQIIGAAIEVHKVLGPGFLEAVYRHALTVELLTRDIPHQLEVALPVFYKDQKLSCGYRADCICFGCVLVELKAQIALTPVDEAQVINYLRATNLDRALLLNFGSERIQIRRFVLSEEFRHRARAKEEITDICD